VATEAEATAEAVEAETEAAAAEAGSTVLVAAVAASCIAREPLLREAGGKVATAEDEPEAEVMGVVLQVPVKAAASVGEEMALGALAGSTVEVAMGMAI
jgi:hypothetical protein